MRVLLKRLLSRFQPTPLPVLENALNSGFSNVALPLIEDISKSNSKLAPEANWILAKWYMGRDEDRSLGHLNSTARVQDQAFQRSIVSISLLARRDPESALRQLQSLSTRKPSTDQSFLYAKIADISDAEKLKGVNRLYQFHGIEGFEKAINTKSLGIGNIVSHASSASVGAKVSVVMPAYNCERTIRSSISSILAQSLTDLELIVVDDSSQDSTWDIINDAATKDHRITAVRHDKNRGTYAARNTGLLRATGDLITVNDSDDWAHPRKLEIQARAIVEDGQPYNFSQGVRVNDRLWPVLEGKKPSALSQNFSSLMMMREDILEIGGWPEMRVAADDEFNQRLQKWSGQGKFFAAKGVPLTLIRVDDTSLTRLGPTSKVSSRFGARKEAQLSYMHWHKSLLPKSIAAKIDPQELPFPLPNICRSKRLEILRYDIVYVADLSDTALTGELLAAFEAGSAMQRTQAVYHWPVLENIAKSVSEEIREAIHKRFVDSVVSGEVVETGSVHIYSPASLENIPDIRISIAADDIEFKRNANRRQKLEAKILFG